ncbi:MAG: hypothetical protein ACKVTZ_22940 [Bacteroidia bacterium]
MKQLYTIILFLCAISLLQAQNDCPAAGNRMLKEAKQARKDSLYEKAINKATSARNCDLNLASQADALILEIFKDIDMQKRTAIKEQKRANENEQKANDEKNKALSAAMTLESQLAYNKDYNKSFYYAQHAWQKDQNNVNVQKLLYRVAYTQNQALPAKTIYQIETRADISKICVSPNNQYIAYWDSQGNLHILDTQLNTQVITNQLGDLIEQRIMAGKAGIADFSFSSNSQQLLVDFEDSTQFIYSIQQNSVEGEGLTTFVLEEELDMNENEVIIGEDIIEVGIDAINGIKKNQNHILVYGKKGIEIWNTSSLTKCYQFAKNLDISAANWASDGKSIISVEKITNIITRWYLYPYLLDNIQVNRISFSGDKSRCVFVNGRNKAIVWDIFQAKAIDSLPVLGKNLEFTWDKKGENLYYYAEDDSILYQFSLKEHKNQELCRLSKSIKYIAWNQTEDKLLIIAQREDIYVWEKSSGKYYHLNENSQYASWQHGADNIFLISNSFIYKLIKTVSTKEDSDRPFFISPSSEDFISTNISRKPNENIFALGISNHNPMKPNHVSFYSIQGEKVIVLPSINLNTKSEIEKIVWQPQADKIALAIEGKLNVIDYRMKKVVLDIVCENILQIEWGVNGEKILLTQKNAIQLWDITTKEMLLELTDKDNTFISATFSPDQKEIWVTQKNQLLCRYKLEIQDIISEITKLGIDDLPSQEKAKYGIPIK